MIKRGREVFKCDICDREFASSTALGGHTSKSHPGLSERYSSKLVIRRSRDLHRQLHKDAKAAYMKLFSSAPVK